MNKNDVLSYVLSPAFISPKSVHDRLYLDFSKRSYENRYIQSSASVSVLKASPKSSDFKIEDTLIQSQMTSKNKLNKLKVKYQAEELKEMRKVPKINELSRIIATQSSGKLSDVKDKYIASILTNSRFVKNAKGVKSAVIKLQDNDSACSVKEYKEQKEQRERKENIEKNEFLKQLRQVVNERVQVMQPEEPPSILEMGVVDRGKYWIRQRTQKLEKLREKVRKQSVEACTLLQF